MLRYPPNKDDDDVSTSALKLENTLRAWGTPDFDLALKNEMLTVDKSLLPLQAGLAQSSHVSDSDISVVILNQTETDAAIQVKIGIFYAGIIAGSCCSDDPTPVCEQTEYCEAELLINKTTAHTTVTLLAD